MKRCDSVRMGIFVVNIFPANSMSVSLESLSVYGKSAPAALNPRNESISGTQVGGKYVLQLTAKCRCRGEIFKDSRHVM